MAGKAVLKVLAENTGNIVVLLRAWELCPTLRPDLDKVPLSPLMLIRAGCEELALEARRVNKARKLGGCAEKAAFIAACDCCSMDFIKAFAEAAKIKTKGNIIALREALEVAVGSGKFELAAWLSSHFQLRVASCPLNAFAGMGYRVALDWLAANLGLSVKDPKFAEEFFGHFCRNLRAGSKEQEDETIEMAKWLLAEANLKSLPVAQRKLFTGALKLGNLTFAKRLVAELSLKRQVLVAWADKQFAAVWKIGEPEMARWLLAGDFCAKPGRKSRAARYVGAECLEKCLERLPGQNQLEMVRWIVQAGDFAPKDRPKIADVCASAFLSVCAERGDQVDLAKQLWAERGPATREDDENFRAGLSRAVEVGNMKILAWLWEAEGFRSAEQPWYFLGSALRQGHSRMAAWLCEKAGRTPPEDAKAKLLWQACGSGEVGIAALLWDEAEPVTREMATEHFKAACDSMKGAMLAWLASVVDLKGLIDEPTAVLELKWALKHAPGGQNAAEADAETAEVATYLYEHLLPQAAKPTFLRLLQKGKCSPSGIRWGVEKLGISRADLTEAHIKAILTVFENRDFGLNDYLVDKLGLSKENVGVELLNACRWKAEFESEVLGLLGVWYYRVFGVLPVPPSLSKTGKARPAAT